MRFKGNLAQNKCQRLPNDPSNYTVKIKQLCWFFLILYFCSSSPFATRYKAVRITAIQTLYQSNTTAWCTAHHFPLTDQPTFHRPDDLWLFVLIFHYVFLFFFFFSSFQLSVSRDTVLGITSTNRDNRWFLDNSSFYKNNHERNY